ncbi:MAG: recombination regulator RecX [Bifidobacteriaceae bacterium]|jgi:regulatory protein|nr:recombination regulator RecX [Bifidobacteriaceae bacterium]
MRIEPSEEAARAIALKALDRVPRSRAQLEDLLEAKGIEPDVARAVLDRFEAVGLVDDQALAEMLVRTRHSERGLVGPVLLAELTRKGIDPETAAAAMEQITSADQVEAASRIARKRLAATSGLARETRLRRLAGVLARKGYPAGQAYAVVRRVLEEEGV